MTVRPLILLVTGGVIALIVFFAQTASADVIALKDGRAVEGEVVGHMDDLVLVEFPGGESGTYRKDEIKGVKHTPRSDTPLQADTEESAEDGPSWKQKAVSVFRKLVNRAKGVTGFPLTEPWPPVVGESFPDLELQSARGDVIRLSQFKGKIIIVEPIGTTCVACQGFAGAGNRDIGPFNGAKVAPGTTSFYEDLRAYGKIRWPHPDIVYVHLLLFGKGMREPPLEEALRWAEHFKMNRADNEYVLVGSRAYTNQAGYDMIPGFFLIDRDFVLRSDSTGHKPKHRFFDHFIPTLRRML